MGQKKPSKLGSTICYGQTWARKSRRDSAVRFVTAKSWPEKATKTRQYDLLRPRVGQKESPRLGNTICYGQTWVRKSHQDSAVRFVTAKVGQNEPLRLGSTICYGQEFGQNEPPRFGNTIYYGQELARKSHQVSAARFVRAKRGPERAINTRQSDLLRPRIGQQKPPRLGSTICYGHELRATNTRQCDFLRPIVGQKKPPRLGSTICYGQTWARKSHQDSAVRFVTAKSWPERATETRQYDLLCPNVAKRATKIQQYDLLRPNMGQKEPPRLGSTICYGQTWARKSYRDSAVRLVTAKRGPERATKTRQYDLLRPNVGQKEPPRLVSTIC